VLQAEASAYTVRSKKGKKTNVHAKFYFEQPSAGGEKKFFG
jgi:hypothetical protein